MKRVFKSFACMIFAGAIVSLQALTVENRTPFNISVVARSPIQSAVISGIGFRNHERSLVVNEFMSIYLEPNQKVEITLQEDKECCNIEVFYDLPKYNTLPDRQGFGKSYTCETFHSASANDELVFAIEKPTLRLKVNSDLGQEDDTQTLFKNSDLSYLTPGHTVENRTPFDIEVHTTKPYTHQAIPIKSAVKTLIVSQYGGVAHIEDFSEIKLQPGYKVRVTLEEDNEYCDVYVKYSFTEYEIPLSHQFLAKYPNVSVNDQLVFDLEKPTLRLKVDSDNKQDY